MSTFPNHMDSHNNEHRRWERLVNDWLTGGRRLDHPAMTNVHRLITSLEQKAASNLWLLRSAEEDHLADNAYKAGDADGFEFHSLQAKRSRFQGHVAEALSVARGQAGGLSLGID